MGLFGNKDVKELDRSLDGIRSNIGVNFCANGVEAVDRRIDEASETARRLAARGEAAKVQACLDTAARHDIRPAHLSGGSHDPEEAHRTFEDQMLAADWTMRQRRWQDAIVAIREQGLEGKSEEGLRGLDTDLGALKRLMGEASADLSNTAVADAMAELVDRTRALCADGQAERVAFRLDRAELQAETYAAAIEELRPLLEPFKAALATVREEVARAEAGG